MNSSMLAMKYRPEDDDDDNEPRQTTVYRDGTEGVEELHRQQEADNKFYTIAHSKRRPVGFGVFECALATVTLPLINRLCYIQQTSEAGLRYIKSAIYTIAH